MSDYRKDYGPQGCAEQGVMLVGIAGAAAWLVGLGGIGLSRTLRVLGKARFPSLCQLGWRVTAWFLRKREVRR